MAVSFIGGGNQSTRKKPPTCRKSLTNLILDAPLTHAYEEDNLCIFLSLLLNVNHTIMISLSG